MLEIATKRMTKNRCGTLCKHY